jgi:hypothetical protein
MWMPDERRVWENEAGGAGQMARAEPGEPSAICASLEPFGVSEFSRRLIVSKLSTIGLWLLKGGSARGIGRCRTPGKVLGELGEDEYGL